MDLTGVDLTIDGQPTIRDVNISWDGTTLRAGDTQGVAVGQLTPPNGLDWLDKKNFLAVGDDGETWRMYRRGCNCG